MKRPNIIIVDNSRTFRQSLIFLLTIEDIAKVIGKASNGIEFIHILTVAKPDLVLMDIDMPEMNGIEATQKALELQPGLKIIILSMYGNEEYYKKLIALGIKGYILKSCHLDELENAIHTVMEGGNYFFADVMPADSTINKFNTVDKILSEDSDLTITELKLLQNINSDS
jgi:DNA-binding NarL/FixJ family response regulator